MVTYIPNTYGSFIPATVSFPVPPPVPRMQVTDEEGFFTPVYMDFIQKLWAAIQGTGGLYETTYTEVLGSGNDFAQIQDVAESIVSLTGGVTDGLVSRVSSIERDIDGVKLAALLALDHGYLTGLIDDVRLVALALDARVSALTEDEGSGGSSSIYAPMVTGETPGPVLVATTDGQCIMVQVE